jgi:hypothetical protein
LAALAAGPAFANRAASDGSVPIPSGSAAIRDEMLAAQKAVKAYDTAVTAYSDWLQQEQQAKAAVGGDKDGLADE